MIFKGRILKEGFEKTTQTASTMADVEGAESLLPLPSLMREILVTVVVVSFASSAFLSSGG